MGVFVTARERRLWLLAGVVLVGILATLGLARVLAEELRARGLIEALFTVALVLIGLAVVAVGLRQRWGFGEVGVVLGVAAVYLLLFLRMTVPEERSHMIEYAVLALLVHEALLERRAGGADVPAPGLLAIVIATAAGALDEGVQLLLPSRVFDPVDLLFNAVAATLAVLGRSGIDRLARRRTRGHAGT